MYRTECISFISWWSCDAESTFALSAGAPDPKAGASLTFGAGHKNVAVKALKSAVKHGLTVSLRPAAAAAS